VNETWLVVVAAGRGERLGRDRPKAFVELAGRPLAAYSMEAGGAAASVDAIIAVGDVSRFEALLPTLSPSVRAKWRGVVPGGGERRDSVRNGCAEVERQAEGDPVVLVHDAARPFASPALLDAVAQAAAAGPALAAAPVADTVKRCLGDRVQETLDRETLALAQTPQGVRLSLLLQADAQAPPGPATDEASLLESAGAAVTLVSAPSTNFKITTPEDLRLAEAWVLAGGAPWMPAGRKARASGRSAKRALPRTGVSS
jgi:2-C-methyl-D-erythritol 4-phosphate cytidylyltransferase